VFCAIGLYKSTFSIKKLLTYILTHYFNTNIVRNITAVSASSVTSPWLRSTISADVALAWTSQSNIPPVVHCWRNIVVTASNSNSTRNHQYRADIRVNLSLCLSVCLSVCLCLFLSLSVHHQPLCFASGSGSASLRHYDAGCVLRAVLASDQPKTQQCILIYISSTHRDIHKYFFVVFKIIFTLFSICNHYSG